jgi:maleamate amidohydrolase
MQHNYRTVVVYDCVADRAKAPHEANLFDIQQKYADVLSKKDVIVQLQTLK